MQIQNRNKGNRGVFFIEEGGDEIGLLHYTLPEKGIMVIDHTEVDEAQEGKGLGRQLVKAAVSYAREHKLKVSPECVFAKKMFEITPEFADVLLKES